LSLSKAPVALEDGAHHSSLRGFTTRVAGEPDDFLTYSYPKCSAVAHHLTLSQPVQLPRIVRSMILSRSNSATAPSTKPYSPP
jgi:hypothetical protein